MDDKFFKTLRTSVLDAEERHEESSRFLGMIQRLMEMTTPGRGKMGAENLLDPMVRMIIEESDFEHCSVVLWDPDSQCLTVRAACSLEDQLESAETGRGEFLPPFEVHEEIVQRVFDTQSPVFLEAKMNQEIHHENGSEVTPVSMVCLPLGDPGVIQLASAHPQRFSGESRRNWELIGRIISAMLSRATTAQKFYSNKGPFDRLSGNGLSGGDEPRPYGHRPVRRHGGGMNPHPHLNGTGKPANLQRPTGETVENGHVRPDSHCDQPEVSKEPPLTQQAMENIPQGICLLDARGSIVYVNQSIERRYGLNALELQDRSPAVLFADPMEFQKLFRAASASGTEELTNVSMVDRYGECYRADVNLSRLANGPEAVGGFLLIIEDMTKRNLLAEKLVQTEKLTTLGTMAGGVAHDFNNLLMAIVGNVQLMAPSIADEDMKKRLQRIEQSVQKGVDTVRRLQQFTNRARDSRSAPGAVDIGEAVQDAMELTRPHWKNAMECTGHRIEFQTDLAPNCPVSMSASDLREVLTNLLFNAVDAMPEGGVITLSSRPLGDQVWVEVSDTGCAMSEGVSKKIFDPFYTTKGVAHSGLGLCVVSSLIARYGGEIRVHSSPGQGTRFQMTLPGTPSPVQASPKAKSKSAPASFRLLVIDDDPEILEILRDMLRLKGHWVTAVEDGRKALQLIDSEEYDLVLTDLGMPEVSGWEIAGRAKAKAPELPVVLITGWGAQYEEEDLTSRGVDQVVSKPLSWDSLLDTLDSLLRPDTNGLTPLKPGQP